MQPVKDILAIFRDRYLIEKALRKAALRTIREHQAEGLPLAMWRNGQVVWMTAEELEAEALAEGLADEMVEPG